MELIPLHDRRHLLNYARNVIEHNIIGRPILDHFIPISCEKEYGGAFVSIYVNDKLRGCIGKFTDMELLIDVVRYTSNMVLSDDRFDPVKSFELPDSKIEISIISELEKITSHDELEIGKHGVYVRGNGKTGTYLPSVAVDNKWNSEQFLMSCLKDKAGLDSLDEVKIFKFETDTFKEIR